MRATWIEVSAAALTHNLSLLRQRAGGRASVCAVVKANAYGHGAVLVAQHVLRAGLASRVAVATVGEAAELRAQLSDGAVPLHVLGSLHPSEAEDAVRAQAIPTVVTWEAASAMAHALAALPPAQRARAERRVHIKVDSGMGRVGCRPSELPALHEHCTALGLHVEGVMTHLATADDDVEFAHAQLRTFHAALEGALIARQRAADAFSAHAHAHGGGARRAPLVHASNSAAALAIGEAGAFDMIRPGIAMYGLLPGDAFRDAGLRPALRWVARPTLVKEVGEGHSVGYGRTYVARRREWIATLPVGYADGLSRALSSRGWMRMRAPDADGESELVPIVGRVSMDQTTVRLPRRVPLDSTVFDVLTPDLDPHTSIYGRAQQLETITYEIGTSLSARIPRMLVQ